MLQMKEMFKEDAKNLGKLLGIRTVDVKEESHTEPVKVTRYVKAINPFGEYVFVTEEDMRRSEELGLSMRRIEDD